MAIDDAGQIVGLDPDRAAGWRTRRLRGGPDRLCDASPGGGPVRGLIDAQRAAIVELFDG